MNNAETPAFPASESEHTRYSFGLTKREYFAAMAMQGICHHYFNNQLNNQANNLKVTMEELLAQGAVLLADQLLKQLELCETK